VEEPAAAAVHHKFANAAVEKHQRKPYKLEEHAAAAAKHKFANTAVKKHKRNAEKQVLLKKEPVNFTLVQTNC
jgi:hypothetical protein